MTRRRAALALSSLALVLLVAGAYAAGSRRGGNGHAAASARARGSTTDTTGASRPATAVTEPRPADHGKPDWVTLHGKEAGKGCAVCHPTTRCTNCHGTEMPHPAWWPQGHGTVALASAAVCTRCHTDTQKDCASCHGIAMPHPSDWVAAGHRAAARAGTASCTKCHSVQTCAKCHAPDSLESCRGCHGAQLAALSRPGGHEPAQCLTCHAQAATAVGPGAGHRTVPVCLTCHPSSRLAPTVGVVSQRAWATTEGQGFAAWTKRAVHATADLGRCRSCHAVHDAAAPTFPAGVNPKAKNCGAGCHGWVQGDVVSRGFTNSSGDPEQTTYRGTISPERLLATGTTKHSTEVYAATGCAGRCHQGPHGAVTPCVSCHSFKPSEPGNLHSTHIPFVSGEQSAADPANVTPGGTVCKYCHQPGSKGVPDGSTLWRAACWNCHLSGHNPVTPYWEMPK